MGNWSHRILKYYGLVSTNEAGLLSHRHVKPGSFTHSKTGSTLPLFAGPIMTSLSGFMLEEAEVNHMIGGGTI
jgi:hypothetical protein